MNWKLIFQLSLFGLAMGVATVFILPSTVEPFFWLVIFIISAYMIATRAPGQNFLHGVLVGIGNSIWITAVHVGLFQAYAARHPSEMAAMRNMAMATHPRLLMLVTGPIIGIISGIIIGLLSLLAARLVRRRTPPAPIVAA